MARWKTILFSRQRRSESLESVVESLITQFPNLEAATLQRLHNATKAVDPDAVAYVAFKSYYHRPSDSQLSEVIAVETDRYTAESAKENATAEYIESFSGGLHEYEYFGKVTQWPRTAEAATSRHLRQLRYVPKTLVRCDPALIPIFGRCAKNPY